MPNIFFFLLWPYNGRYFKIIIWKLWIMFQYTVFNSFLERYKKKPKKEKTQTFCSVLRVLCLFIHQLQVCDYMYFIMYVLRILQILFLISFFCDSWICIFCFQIFFEMSFVIVLNVFFLWLHFLGMMFNFHKFKTYLTSVSRVV